jgi:HD-GYP domain-containing protein (c-di-GMP phosphodiesterase class II)
MFVEVGSASSVEAFEAALKEIELWSGRQFDPQIVTAFLEMPANIWKDLRNSP